MPTTASRCDVAVVGGGPAGAAAAIALRRAGLSVALVEGTRYEMPRPGEALPPAVRPILADLGLPMPDRDWALASFGIQSAWGSAELWAGPFLVSPYGDGAHVDRASFDASLSDAAERLGATVLRGTRVTRCAPYGERAWRLSASGAELTAAGVIYASGRETRLVRELGARRRVIDQLVGVTVTYSGDRNGGGATLVEATRDGWWYSAPLPGSGRVAVFMTDADICREGRYHNPARWAEAIAETQHVRESVEGLSVVSRPRVAAAASHRLIRADAPGRWLAAGDTAMGVDPLSGTGVLRALMTGEAAGTAMAHWLVGDDAPVAAYERWLDTRFADYVRERAQHYALETRWPDALFWRRRGSSIPLKAQQPITRPIL